MKPTKSNHIVLTLALLTCLSTLNPQLSTVFAQGSLTPPGAPAPTMKTLDQIEPRTIVNAANTPGDSGNSFIITNAGSYYLTTNLVGVSSKNGIKIAANNVALDLNGFALLGVSGSLSAVDIPGAQTNVTVQNGAISGWGLVGVYVESALSRNMVFERLNISANFGGISSGGAGVVRDCVCLSNLVSGIDSSGGIVSGCTADFNGSFGINVTTGTIVSGCSVRNNGGFGIYVTGGKVSGCLVSGNVQSGIYVYGSGTAVVGNTCLNNNTSISSSHAGICIINKNNRVEDNLVTGSGYAGIQVINSSSYSNNIIVKNTVISSSVTNYSIPTGQIVGPLITNAVSGVITNSNPWANFSF